MYIDIAYADRLAELTFEARAWWCIAVGSLLMLSVVVVRAGRRCSPQLEVNPGAAVPASLLKRLHRGESATASMEYLLVLFPFLIIVMTVWQLAFMINAQMHVAYAAYGAARSASVVISTELTNEKEGLLKKQDDSGATKWRRIRDAAIPGTLAISPGDFGAAGMVALASSVRRGGVGNLMQLPDASAIIPRFTLMTAHHLDPGFFSGTRLQRGLVKNAYAEKMTQVLVNKQDHTKTQDLAGASRIEVTVNYIFWLHVPYVGRLMEAMFEGYQNPITGEYILLNPYPSMQLSETISMTNWPRRRAIEPCT